jgi:hypothetical protein
LRKQLMKIHTRLQVALTESFKENSQTPQPWWSSGLRLFWLELPK